MKDKTKDYLSIIAYILIFIGFVMSRTSKSWGADIAWYKYTSCILFLIGFSINAYVEFPHPFRAAKRSKKIWAIFRICFIATLAMWIVYILFMKLMGHSLEI